MTSSPVSSLPLCCGTRYSNIPSPRTPTTTPRRIRTPIFFSRRASHTFGQPPAQRRLLIPIFPENRWLPRPIVKRYIIVDSSTHTQSQFFNSSSEEPNTHYGFWRFNWRGLNRVQELQWVRPALDLHQPVFSGL